MTLRIITAFFMTALLFGTIPTQLSSCAAAQEAEQAEIEQPEDTKGTKDPEDETEDRKSAVEEGKAGENEPEIEYPEPTAEEKARIEELIEQLGSEDFETREAAEKELIKMGLVVIPFVRKAQTESEDPEVRMRCKSALAELRVKELQVKWNVSDNILKKISGIFEVLEGHESIRKATLHKKLASIGTQDAVDVLVRIWERGEGSSELVKAFQQHADKAVDGIVSAMVTGRVKKQTTIEFGLWGLEKARNADVAVKLFECVDHPQLNDRVRKSIRGIIRKQHDWRPLVPSYIQVLRSKDEKTAKWALRFLIGRLYHNFGFTGKKNGEQLKAAIKAFQDLWEKHKNSKEVEFVKASILDKSNSRFVRILALKRLAKLGDGSINKDICKYLENEDREFRWTCAETLYVLGDKAPIEKSIALIKKKDEREIDNMMWLAKKLGAGKEVQQAFVSAFLDKSANEKFLLFIIYKMQDQYLPGISDKMRAIVENKKTFVQLRIVCLRKYTRVNADGAVILARGIIIDDEEAGDLRRKAIRVLGEQGDTQSVPAMLSLSDKRSGSEKYLLAIRAYQILTGELPKWGSKEFHEKEDEYVKILKQLWEACEDQE